MFNLFHQRHDPSIVCAVRNVGVMPGFLRKDRWEYGGQTDSLRSDLAYDNTAAEAVIEQTGFYLYARH